MYNNTSVTVANPTHLRTYELSLSRPIVLQICRLFSPRISPQRSVCSVACCPLRFRVCHFHSYLPLLAMPFRIPSRTYLPRHAFRRTLSRIHVTSFRFRRPCKNARRILISAFASPLVDRIIARAVCSRNSSLRNHHAQSNAPHVVHLDTHTSKNYFVRLLCFKISSSPLASSSSSSSSSLLSSFSSSSSS